jgi:site-specific DNA recombinase
MKVALYCRVSTEEQVKGHSLAYQVKAAREYAAARGWKVVAEYRDEGFSAKTDRRPQFQAMIAAARRHEFEGVVVWKLDRFSRSREDAVTYKALLRREGVRVHSVTEPTDDSPASIITEAMLEAVAEWYSADLKQKVSAARRHRAETGLWNNRLPHGYKSRGARRPPAIDKEKASGVRRAFELYATGRHTFAQVAGILNREGYPSPSGRSWLKDTVRDMLANRFYLGFVQYRGEWRPGRQQALVDPRVFERCQEIRRERYAGPRSHVQNYRVYLLQGLLRCSVCGEKLQANASVSGNLYYREVSVKRGISCSAPQGSVNAALVEEQMGTLVAALRPPDDWQEMVQEMVARADPRTEAMKTRELLLERLRRIRRQHLDCEMTDAEYDAERTTVHAKIASLVIPTEEAALEAGEVLETMAGVWQEASREEKRAMLRLALSGIYIDMETKRIVALQPRPCFMPLFRLCDAVTEQGPLLVGIGDPEGIRTLDLHRDRVAC